MKTNKLTISTLLYFLIINTSYFWEGTLEIFTIPVFLFLFIIYLVFTFLLFKNSYLVLKESFKNPNRLLLVVLLILTLTTTFLKPFGLIDFERFESKDILIAQREGVANSTMTLKLEENNTYTTKEVCFGITKTRGNYKIIGDTIYFENSNTYRAERKFYNYAVLKTKKVKNKTYFELECFSHKQDTIGHPLKIIKNKLFASILNH